MAALKRCLDTYALVEIYLGNEKFAEYLNLDFVITDITLAEFYGILLREYGENEAEYWIKKLERYAVSVDRKSLIEAVKFRYEHKKQNLSFFDAVGYVFSLNKGFIFVTGDKEFQHFSNVEFKKK